MFNKENRRIKKRIILIIIALTVLIFTNNSEAGKKKVKGKVVFIGIDAADWYFIEPLLKEGKLKFLNSILKDSSYSKLSTDPLSPNGEISAPMQWTTLATGKIFRKHGIASYYPLYSSMRKTPAIWNILSEHNIRVGIVGWPVTWPAERVNGFMVSNYGKYRATPPDNMAQTKTKKLQLTFTGTVYKDKENKLNQTYPREFYYEVESIIQKEELIKDKKIHSQFRNLKISSQKFYDTKWNYIANEIFSDIGLLLLKKSDLDFVGVVMHGVDVAFHRNKDDTPCLLEDYYAYIDRKLGQYLVDIDKDTTLIVASEHGNVGKRGHNHNYEAIDGIIIIKGPDIKKNYKIMDASILDIAPTILYLFDLGIPKDMDGEILIDIFEDNYVRNHMVKKTKPCGEFTNNCIVTKIMSSFFDNAIVERLQRIGYFNEKK